MINLNYAQLEKLSVHRVGNKSRNEPIFLSEKAYEPDQEKAAILKAYFLKPFSEKEEAYFHFDDEVALPGHERLHDIIEDAFSDKDAFEKHAKSIAKLLYDASNHTHIKSGEVFVALFSDLVVEQEKVEAIGVFKSEMKHEFLTLQETGSYLDILINQGINVNKLDKGCLILNINAEDGYKILSIDTNRYDTKYWLERFLGVSPLADDRFFTKSYLKFCQNFAKDVVFPAEDKQQEVLFMNRAVNHFAKNDSFEEDAFLGEVMGNKDLIPEFKQYKIDRGPKYHIEDVSSFGIENSAVKDARKSIKSTISLDTNVEIKLDFVNPESAEKFVEKGWDEERQMFYYLVYFNTENKR